MAFLTPEANGVVAPIHPRSMPVILRAGDYEAWLTGDVATAAALQRPLPDDALEIAFTGTKSDPREPAGASWPARKDEELVGCHGNAGSVEAAGASCPGGREAAFGTGRVRLARGRGLPAHEACRRATSHSSGGAPGPKRARRGSKERPPRAHSLPKSIVTDPIVADPIIADTWIAQPLTPRHPRAPIRG